MRAPLNSPLADENFRSEPGERHAGTRGSHATEAHAFHAGAVVRVAWLRTRRAVLPLEMNRARHAEITQEIMEVVAGAEALV